MYVITGGAGFIGSALLAKLNEEGITDIAVVDDLGTSEKWRNLSNKRFVEYFHKNQFLELFVGDLLPWDIRGIIHLGACSSTTETDAEYVMQNNYCYTKELAEAALERGIRFIYASSAATYGDGSQGFSDTAETTKKLVPLNVYGLSKQLFDLWALETGAASRMAGIKFFNVYGPNEYHKADMRSVVIKSYEQLKAKGSISLFRSYRPEYGDGQQQRDFVYIKDCTEVLWWLLNNESANGLFNLGSGAARSWNELAAAVCGALNIPTSIEYVEMPESLRPKYQYFTQADLQTLSETGCPLAFRTLEEGVRDYVSNYLEQDLRVL